MTPKATFRELSVNFPDAFSVKGLLCHAAGWYNLWLVRLHGRCGGGAELWRAKTSLVDGRGLNYEREGGGYQIR